MANIHSHRYTWRVHWCCDLTGPLWPEQLSNFIGLFHPLFWVEPKLSVGVKGLTVAQCEFIVPVLLDQNNHTLKDKCHSNHLIHLNTNLQKWPQVLLPYIYSTICMDSVSDLSGHLSQPSGDHWVLDHQIQCLCLVIRSELMYSRPPLTSVQFHFYHAQRHDFAYSYDVISNFRFVLIVIVECTHCWDMILLVGHGLRWQVNQ